MIKITSDNKCLSKFLDYLNKEIEETNTSLILSLSEVYMDNVRVAGYFDNESNKIVVYFNETWLETLVHEFSHYLQNKKKKSCWERLDNSLDIMWGWINKDIELSKKEITIAIHKVQRMELDCERTSIKLIKRFKLDMDLEKYIRNANMYIYFHNYVLEKRTWYKEDMGIESFKKLLKLMPKDLKGCRNNMPLEWISIIDEYFQ